MCVENGTGGEKGTRRLELLNTVKGCSSAAVLKPAPSDGLMSYSPICPNMATLVGADGNGSS